MKKLKLQLNGIKQMLSKNEMKRITGGYIFCYIYCNGVPISAAPTGGNYNCGDMATHCGSSTAECRCDE